MVYESVLAETVDAGTAKKMGVPAPEASEGEGEGEGEGDSDEVG